MAVGILYVISLVRTRSCVWCVSCAARSWCVSEEAGWHLTSSWSRMIHAEVRLLSLQILILLLLVIIIIQNKTSPCFPSYLHRSFICTLFTHCLHIIHLNGTVISVPFIHPLRSIDIDECFTLEFTSESCATMNTETPQPICIHYIIHSYH